MLKRAQRPGPRGLGTIYQHPLALQTVLGVGFGVAQLHNSAADLPPYLGSSWAARLRCSAAVQKSFLRIITLAF